MADSCCTYMHEPDVVYRWLPSEILRDIGIVEPAERRRLTVVEDLASVLGSAAMERTQNYHGVLLYRMTNSHQRTPAIPQRCRRRRSRATAAGRCLVKPLPLPRFAPAPARRPPLPVAATIPLPVNRSSGGGTGVFLPRTELYRGARATARPAGGDDDAGMMQPPRHGRRQQQCRSSKRHVGAATRSRLQLHHLHAHAAAEQPARTEKPRACAQLALPREYVY